MAYIYQKVQAYLEEMNELDGKEKKRKKDVKRLRELARDKEKMQQRKKQYQKLKEQLEQSPNTQISTVDPDARALVIKTDVVEVAYNTQVATDDKHNLIVHYEVTNKMDRKALHPTSLAAKQNMGLGEGDKLTVLADKGFFNGEQLHACREDHIMTYVPNQSNQHLTSVPVKGFKGEEFVYHPKADTYTCPEGHTLTTNGQWYKKTYVRDEKTKSTCLVKHYKTDRCLTCPVMHLCTANKMGRLIERSQYAEAVEENLRRVREHKEVYLRRQQIVEHPFGTIKRWWGYTYTLMKGLQKVGADMGLVYLCYNLKRVMNILTPRVMLKKLQVAWA